MKRNKFKVRVIYQRKKYYFDFGSQVYIFHIGICNCFLFEYGIDELLKYFKKDMSGSRAWILRGRICLPK